MHPNFSLACYKEKSITHHTRSFEQNRFAFILRRKAKKFIRNVFLIKIFYRIRNVHMVVSPSVVDSTNLYHMMVRREKHTFYIVYVLSVIVHSPHNFIIICQSKRRKSIYISEGSILKLMTNWNIKLFMYNNV